MHMQHDIVLNIVVKYQLVGSEPGSLINAWSSSTCVRICVSVPRRTIIICRTLSLSARTRMFDVLYFLQTKKEKEINSESLLWMTIKIIAMIPKINRPGSDISKWVFYSFRYETPQGSTKGSNFLYNENWDSSFFLFFHQGPANI